VLTDPVANDIVKGLLADVNQSFGQETEDIDAIVGSEDPSVDANEFAAQNFDKLEAAFGEESFIGQLLGGFSEGLRNKGQERKGSRDGARRLTHE